MRVLVLANRLYPSSQGMPSGRLEAPPGVGGACQAKQRLSGNRDCLRSGDKEREAEYR
jgi:hypothetical protein